MLRIVQTRSLGSLQKRARNQVALVKLIEIQVVRDDEPAKICGAEAAEALEILRYLKIFYDAYGILWLVKTLAPQGVT